MFYGSVIQTLHPLFVFRLDMWEVNGFLSELKTKLKQLQKLENKLLNNSE